MHNNNNNFLLQDLFGFKSTTPQEKLERYKKVIAHSRSTSRKRPQQQREKSTRHHAADGGADNETDLLHVSTNNDNAGNDSFASISEQQCDYLYQESMRVQRELFSSDVGRCMRGLVKLENYHAQIKSILNRKMSAV